MLVTSYAQTKMQRLLHSLDFTFLEQYFDYCINSWYNGQVQQCKELFYRMPKVFRKSLVSYIECCYDAPEEKQVYKFYFSLL